MSQSKTLLALGVVTVVGFSGYFLINHSIESNNLSTEENVFVNKNLLAGTASLLDSNVTSTTDSNSVKNNLSLTSSTVMQKATLQTNLGNIVLELDTTNTPNTAENFKKLADQGFYNGTRFHRIIDGFMIQGGDPQSRDITKKDLWGTGGPGYQFADEIKPTNNNAVGTISMANAGPNTNGSQFFINTADNSFLNPKHTVFGKVISGMDVVEKISKAPTGINDQPNNDIIIEKIIIE
jgi:cyclophilin family peptidyl-prolyl cis-trans isomerase